MLYRLYKHTPTALPSPAINSNHEIKHVKREYGGLVLLDCNIHTVLTSTDSTREMLRQFLERTIWHK